MAMVTTIQLQESTLKTLRYLKESMHCESYDEAINLMIKKVQKPEKSLAGFLGKANMSDLMDGLRDEDGDD